jgi:phage terminase large subunit-like protein
MSPDQVEELHRLAAEYDRNIVVVGGWAENEQGVQNRIDALREYKKDRPAPRYDMPAWRNKGAPTSGLNIPGSKPDFDYWTRRGRRDLPEGLRRDLAVLFGIDVNKMEDFMDNYNHFPSGAKTVPPPGALTFHARTGTVTRRVAPWQKPPRW